MKYTNKYNGHTYFIESGVVMFGSDGLFMESSSSVSDFNRMIELGELVPVKPTRENFRDLVNEAKKDNPGLQIRFVAFIAHIGFKEAYAGTVAQRNARFIRWMTDRKADYVRLRGHMVKNDYCTGYHSILDHDDFTDFIVSGEWL